MPCAPRRRGLRRIKRRILANLAISKAGAPTNLVMVTSALPGEGKTFVRRILAISIALEMDRTVLLVDADVAKPSMPRDARSPKPSRTDGCTARLPDRSADVLWKTTIDKLMLLPAGTTHQHATELLASEAMAMLLQEMAARYRTALIVFDSPPLLPRARPAPWRTIWGRSSWWWRREGRPRAGAQGRGGPHRI